MSAKRFDVAVVGEGLAGLTAAGHAASLGAHTATFEAALFGGLVVNVASLQGFADGASGIEVAAALSESNAEAGVQSIAAAVTSIRPDGDGFVIETKLGSHGARRVILATGTRPRSLGLPDEERLYGHGVSRCADCDGPLFEGQPVAVVGGGDAAFMQAATVAKVAAEVLVLVRNRMPRARRHFIEALTAMPNARVVTDARITALHGGDALESVEVEVDGERRLLNVPGLFVYVGGEPVSELAMGLAPVDSVGGILAGPEGVTECVGLYAVGAVRSGFGGRLADAQAEALRCAAHAVASLRS